MKNLLTIFFILASFSSFAQITKMGGMASRVNDSTTYVTSPVVTQAHTDGYSDIWFSNTSNLWWVWDASAYVNWDPSAAGGGGSGGGVNIYNADSTLSGNRTITTSNFYLRLLGTGTDIPKFVLDAPNNVRKAIHFRTGNLDRWQMHVEDNETGSGNTGTNLHFERFDDAGAFIDAPFGIRRTDGIAFFANGAEVPADTYGAGWNNNNEAAPKGDIYDKIEASISIPQVSVSTASGTITLDMQSLNAKSFFGSATFATPKTMAMSNVNDGCACLSSFNFWFEVTNVAAVLTFPADWFSGNANFDGTSWTPPAVGIYEFGGSYNDDANRWSIKISNPEQ